MEFLYIIILFSIISFIWNWIKVKFVMMTLGSKGNSFMYTIMYLLGKNEIRDILSKK